MAENKITFSEWLNHYDTISEAAVAAMAEKYKDVRLTFEEWEDIMDKLCEAHPEWAEDN